ncbi:Putative glycosyltransferase EpsF [Pirellula sp. SH-Sr6A]|uniref:glycosyltransferase n=1 Tax=Pirellula sp. SH-Sr6A TaxID=1632865 RepID=UPI00078D375F|nr:glycosyltransferase [Pirellula sp. SH-Sr6A]AMV30824.1 Putative glycosyltransferase EpsF [Pirellula sp. SH-Sr6A]
MNAVASPRLRPISTPSSQPTASSATKRALRTTFVITSMPVGGAETLLVNLVRGFDDSQIEPSVVCLKDRGPLGQEISSDFPVYDRLLKHKYDIGILNRLTKHFRREKTDAVITVGAGDKMFWGRLAARRAGVPVICSALHSTGWPDGIGKLNRMLTCITDGFIGVAKSHGEFLVEQERFPKSKVFVIPNGVDTRRFAPSTNAYQDVRTELGIPSDAKLIGIVAALRPEKNHGLFLQLAKRLQEKNLKTHFVIIGDGPERASLRVQRATMGLQHCVHFLGSRSDTPRLLAAMDLFVLTSHNEASPVSILEALACEVPVVASRVGSIPDTVLDGWNGYTATPGSVSDFEKRVQSILDRADESKEFGRNGRQFVESHASLQNMVDCYTDLIGRIYEAKQKRS